MRQIDEYQSESMKTAAGDVVAIRDRKNKIPDGLLHSLIGLQDEIGEIAKAIKAHIYYGRELDIDNLIEEYGDVAWYWQLGVSSLGAECSHVLSVNREKLSNKDTGRYKGGVFSEHEANNRDTDTEARGMR